MLLSKRISFIILLVSLLAGTDMSAADQQNWFEEGLLAEFRGEYKEALTIWLNAKDQLETVDARIGFEFIRLATEQDMNDYYEDASDMYYWALQGEFSGINRVALRQEIERLRPIIGEGVYKQWLSWWEKHDRKLTRDMRGFWIQLDPTPSNKYNERLLEHWERIAHSRIHFVKNTNTVYGTDDRALIYVRYGEPAKSETGVLTLMNFNIGRWLGRQFESGSSRDLETEELRVPERELRDSYEELEDYIFQFHEFPEYEIWIYDEMVQNDGSDLIHIFGTDVNTGEFVKQGSVDDFIPQRAFLSDRRALRERTEFVREGLTPALVLQMLYYEQLMHVHNYFEQRLNMIQEAFVEQGPLAYASLDLSLKSQNRELLEMRSARSPRQISRLDKLVKNVPFQLYQYIMLNEDNQPYLLSFIESRPLNVLKRDIEEHQQLMHDAFEDPDDVGIDSLVSFYEIRQLLQFYDDEWNIEQRLSDYPSLMYSQLLDNGIITSVFETPQERRSFQAASVELINPHFSDSGIALSPFPPSLRGIGTLQYQQPAPLSTDKYELQVADLILGYSDVVPEDYPFSFLVANDQSVPGDRNLMLHFEVYHLEPRPQTGFTHFELTYRIFPVAEDGTVLTDEEEFYITLNFESEFTRVAEDLEIATSQLSKGLYELQLYFTDIQSGQEQSQSVRFEVLED